MSKGRRVFYFTIFFIALALSVAFFAGGRRGREGAVQGPELERALGAATIAEELAAVARSQLDSLSEDGRRDVEGLIVSLEERAANVRRLARKSGGADELKGAAADLDELLSEIIRDYKPSP